MEVEHIWIQQQHHCHGGIHLVFCDIQDIDILVRIVFLLTRHVSRSFRRQNKNRSKPGFSFPIDRNRENNGSEWHQDKRGEGYGHAHRRLESLPDDLAYAWPHKNFADEDFSSKICIPKVFFPTVTDTREGGCAPAYNVADSGCRHVNLGVLFVPPKRKPF